MHSLQTILNIIWQGRVSNLQVLDMAKSTRIEAMILKSLGSDNKATSMPMAGGSNAEERHHRFR